MMKNINENISNIENFKPTKLSVDDSGEYWEIRQEMVEKDPQAFGFDKTKENEKYWKDYILNPYNSFYGIKINNKFVSTAASLTTEENVCLIKNVYTKEEFRGRGFSEKLLDVLINEARVNGIKKLNLWVNYVDSPQVAKKMYEKLGFKKVDEYKYPNSDVVFSEFMEKDFL